MTHAGRGTVVASMRGSGPIVLAVYLLVLVALATMRAIPIRSRAVQRLRALLPSWRFFEELGEVPVLQLRHGARADALGTWVVAVPPVRRRPWAVIENAEANLALAAGSLLQHLAADLSELPDDGSGDIAALVSYQLTDHLAGYQLARLAPAARHYQFRLIALTPGQVPPTDDRDDDDNELVRSPVTEVARE